MSTFIGVILATIAMVAFVDHPWSIKGALILATSMALWCAYKYGEVINATRKP